MSLEEDLQLLEVKIKQLKLDYEQYFMGQRPREPIYERGQVQKQMIFFSSNPIKNTAQRFKFNTIQSRFQTFKRQWDGILRQIENGTYERHVFRANLRDRSQTPPAPGPAKAGAKTSGGDLFESYRDAAKACGQDVAGLNRKKLERVIERQEAQIRNKFGCDQVKFRVVVKDGKVKLKASPVK